jgi:hypothetical protein
MEGRGGPVAVEASILKSVKKTLGLDESLKAFDQDLLMHINTVFFTLNQLGLGPVDGFMVEDDTEVWEDFTGGRINLNAVKTYVYLRVRLLFDPPGTSYHIAAIEKQVEELTYRLQMEREVFMDGSVPTRVTDGDGVLDGDVDGVSFSAIYRNAKV